MANSVFSVFSVTLWLVCIWYLNFGILHFAALWYLCYGFLHEDMMAKPEPLRIAIIGAGPIGLEAGLYVPDSA